MYLYNRLWCRLQSLVVWVRTPAVVGRQLYSDVMTLPLLAPVALFWWSTTKVTKAKFNVPTVGVVYIAGVYLLLTISVKG